MSTPRRPAIRFSMFDWLDESGRGYAQTYDERLQVLERADRAGFHAYFLAEHHGTSLSQTPSPSLFLSAVAQRTERLRLGALTWCLPLYHPIRLLEELCMLDQLSHGRLELGVGRGVSPHESVRMGVPPEESKERFSELLKLLITGFTTGELNADGRFYKYDHVKTRFRTVQQPYPPMWYPTSSIDSMAWIGAQGLNVVVSLLHSPSFDRACEMLARYREAWQAHRNDPGRANAHVAEPEVAFTTHIHVAETDQRAHEQAREAYSQFHENFVRRYIEIGQGDKYANRPSFDQFVERSQILCGSPDTVRKILGSHLAKSGANHFVGAFTFGSLGFEATCRSVELFGKEVIPALQGT
jgi:alkanesulfonate monooxygenase SsuD/methylene tetrahydromethanopterin reductase-like flavin-dependent oxidoreductase (luciferase family)